MTRSIFKKVGGKRTQAWDVDPNSRKFVYQSESRRKLRDRIHRMNRKNLNNVLT